MNPPGPPEPDRQDRLRAALLAIVLFIHGVAASPLPDRVRRADFENPIAAEEMRRWSALLGRVGVEISPDELVDRVLVVGQAASQIPQRVVKPLRPLLRVTGTGQGWGLFTYPNTHPHRMIIEVREGGEWRTLFRALDPEHDWMAEEFAFRRVRGVYDDNTSRVRASYGNFVRWVAREAFAELPEADRLRVKFVRGHVVHPGQVHDPETTVRLVRTVTRSQVTP